MIERAHIDLRCGCTAHAEHGSLPVNLGGYTFQLHCSAVSLLPDVDTVFALHLTVELSTTWSKRNREKVSLCVSETLRARCSLL